MRWSVDTDPLVVHHANLQLGKIYKYVTRQLHHNSGDTIQENKILLSRSLPHTLGMAPESPSFTGHGSGEDSSLHKFFNKDNHFFFLIFSNQNQIRNQSLG